MSREVKIIHISNLEAEQYLRDEIERALRRVTEELEQRIDKLSEQLYLISPVWTDEHVAHLCSVQPRTVRLWARQENDPLPASQVGRTMIIDPKAFSEWALRNKIQVREAADEEG
jgi:hypothetical protein